MENIAAKQKRDSITFAKQNSVAQGIVNLFVTNDKTFNICGDEKIILTPIFGLAKVNKLEFGVWDLFWILTHSITLKVNPEPAEGLMFEV